MQHPEPSPTHVLALDHLCLIQVQGADAAQFLHQQCTQDVLLMPDHSARYSAWCSSKGRVIASFVLLKHSPQCLWIVALADIADVLVTGLRKYILRAKVQIQRVDAGAVQILGLLEDISPHEDTPAPLTVTDWQVSADLHPQRLQWAWPAGAGAKRSLVVQAAAADASPIRSTADAANWAHWQWAEIASAVWLVGQTHSDQFIPQMLNYESLDFIHFKKGCYPGQEVVARSQFRGQVKRRLTLLHTNLAAATELRPELTQSPTDPAEDPIGN